MQYGWVEIIQDGARQTQVITKSPFTIGRADDNALVIDSGAVMNQHAQINCYPGGCEIKDLNSTTGTLVDGDRVDSNVPRLLGEGSTIDIGNAHIIMHLHGAPPAVAPVVDDAMAAAPVVGGVPKLRKTQRLRDLVASQGARASNGASRNAAAFAAVAPAVSTEPRPAVNPFPAPLPFPVPLRPAPSLDSPSPIATNGPATGAPAVVHSASTPATLPEEGAAGAVDAASASTQPMVPTLVAPMPINLAVTPAELTVEPGGFVSGLITVINQSDIVDRIDLAVDGLPEPWVTIAPKSLGLFPRSQATAQFVIRVPLGQRTMAGPHAFAVVARPDQTAATPVTQAAMLNVQPFTRFATEIRPAQRTGKREGSYQLLLVNSGNKSLPLTFAAHDDAGALSFGFVPPALALAPYQAGVVRVRARAERTHWFGRPITYPFLVTATPTDESAASQQVAGRLVQRAIVSPLLLALLLLLLLTSCLLLALAFGPRVRPFIEGLNGTTAARATAAAAASATQAAEQLAAARGTAAAKAELATAEAKAAAKEAAAAAQVAADKATAKAEALAAQDKADQKEAAAAAAVAQEKAETKAEQAAAAAAAAQEKAETKAEQAAAAAKVAAKEATAEAKAAAAAAQADADKAAAKAEAATAAAKAEAKEAAAAAALAAEKAEAKAEAATAQAKADAKEAAAAASAAAKEATAAAQLAAKDATAAAKDATATAQNAQATTNAAMIAASASAAAAAATLTPTSTATPDMTATAVAIAARTPTSTPLLTATPGPTSTPTLTPTPTETPSPTLTPTPTETPSPTPTATSTFTVTSVTASVSPVSSNSCPTTYNFTGVITADGPGTVTYQWDRSDGTTSGIESIVFESAGSLPVTTSWQRAASETGWMRLRTLAPNTVVSNPATFSVACFRAPTSIVTTVSPETWWRCPMTFIISSEITMDGPGTVTYQWDRSDGTVSSVRSVTFTQAGTQTVVDEWTLPDEDERPQYAWERLRTLDPRPIVSNQASFMCGYEGATYGMSSSLLPALTSTISPTITPVPTASPSISSTQLLTPGNTSRLTTMLYCAISSALGSEAGSCDSHPAEKRANTGKVYLPIVSSASLPALPIGLALASYRKVRRLCTQRRRPRTRHSQLAADERVPTPGTFERQRD